MRKHILIILLILITLKVVNSQNIGSNLVENPSFEEKYDCPTSTGQLYLAKKWWGNCSSLLHVCNSSYAGVPLNQYGSQYPKTGMAYAHFAPYGWCNELAPGLITGRGFIFSKTTQKLHKDKKYSFELFISLPDFYSNSIYGTFFLDSIGLCFLNDSLNKDSLSSLIFYELVKPLTNISLSGNVDTLNWKKLRSFFVAKGNDEFFAIGNFSKYLPTSVGDHGIFQLYVDDVSICELSFDIDLGADTSICEGESIVLNPNLPNATYTWQDSSHTATYEVKQPGTYWVRAYVADYDVYSSDTIVITQGDDSFCNPPLTIPNVITPNGDGANDNFVIQNAESYNITLQIYNRWGKLIYENTNYQNDFSCKTCASGVYYYVIKAKSKRNGRAKEYKGSLTIVSG